ncbi:translation initiation factor IF-2-like [Solenopsis invicta]|uniref:translation initiation factor IF-2-like n=1 Tax=Solenopsis invicta TaxID=13686 RepID=UPI00193D391D|nr:translation initiation factor IF-2-like [Solenopsis invicta]
MGELERRLARIEEGAATASSLAGAGAKRAPSTNGPEWATVVGRKEKRRAAAGGAPAKKPAPASVASKSGRGCPLPRPGAAGAGASAGVGEALPRPLSGVAAQRKEKEGSKGGKSGRGAAAVSSGVRCPGCGGEAGPEVLRGGNPGGAGVCLLHRHHQEVQGGNQPEGNSPSARPGPQI